MAALIEHDSREWEVDIVDFEPAATSPLAFVQPGQRADLPPGHPGIPRGWAVGDTWTLITHDGAESRSATGFAAYAWGGSGALHFVVRLGPAPAGVTGPALAIRGRPDKTPSRLRVPPPAPCAKLSRNALARIADALRPHLDPAQQATLRNHALAARHVKMFPGSFPGGRTHAICVRLGPPDDRPSVSALLFAAADGNVELFQAAELDSELELFGLVDLDGDGIDEIVYEDEYHEGWYLKLAHWTQAGAEARILTGDGV